MSNCSFFSRIPAPAKRITLRELLAARCREYGDKVLLIDPHAEKSWTYREFYDAVVRVSGLFWKQGVRKGSKVSLLMHNSPGFLFSFFALARLGAVACPEYASEGRRTRFADNSDSVGLVITEGSWRFPQVLAGLPKCAPFTWGGAAAGAAAAMTWTWRR